jgi:hypothetical protein|tara:strand:+ start:693 stop:953 length:261 start_codon:yes stop_codon:yes gene_type:complete
MEYKEATIKIDVPIVRNEKGKIYQRYSVKGMIRILEGQIINLMATNQRLTKTDDMTRHEDAKFMLGELKKFYLADEAKIETLPLEK